MEGSTPQHYTISDFIKWYEDGELILNPDFQRGQVWPSHAKSYLIDSILRGYPIPKLLLRTIIDRQTRRTVRDVVDGQQRLRTILEFADGKLRLGSKAGEFQGHRYNELEDEIQDKFLSYKLTCEQLINASDDDVLEVFARINSYTVPVNEAELRNAKYDSDFSSYVKEAAVNLKDVWSLGILTERDRVRMADQSTVAELMGFLQHGISDGSETDITKIYETNNSLTLDQLPDVENFESIIREAAELLKEFSNEPIVKRPHFLMFVAALMHIQSKLPRGKVGDEYWISNLPGLATREAITDNLLKLNTSLNESESELTPDLEEFRDARATTQRMKSRNIRFEKFTKALIGTLK